MSQVQAVREAVEEARKDPMLSDNPEAVNYWLDDAALTVRDQLGIDFVVAWRLVNNYEYPES